MGYFCSGSDMLCPICQFLILGQNSPATATGDSFISIKAQHAKIPECPAMPVSTLGANGFCRILHNRNVPGFGYFNYLFYSAGMAKGVHGNYGCNALPGYLIISGIVF